MATNYGMTIRYASMVLVAAMVAVVAAIALLAAEPKEAEAAKKPRPATTSSVTSCTGESIALSANEKRILDLTNKERTSRGLNALCVHPALTKAARYHSEDMLSRDYLAHTSPDGETVTDRMKKFGYNYSWWAENIYMGYGCCSAIKKPWGDPDSAHHWWMNSSTHKSAILDKNHKEVGIGVVTGTYKGYTDAAWYTVDFGSRQS